MEEPKTIVEAYRKISRIQRFIALFFNFLILSTSFLLLILLKYKDASLIYFFCNVMLCLEMWFFLIYFKLVHFYHKHNNKKRDDGKEIIGFTVATQLLFIVQQVLVCLK